ncbi:hypothetical protein AX15_002321 [Amanita polypyramis BW_CC]|nr:hypothetical protein AX15_002321 [Amanita polypyramis BW_CC]
MEKNEEMDLETLQAQIDMSMSFAHDLVSSWIEPSKIATTSRNYDLEKELKDYMRRPPRLGVGVFIPETNALPTETARLKGKLRDKGKTKRTEEVMRQSDSDDAKETKASIIKKRIKLDPFAALSKPGKTSTNSLPATTQRTSKEGVNSNVKHSGDTPRKPTAANLNNTPDSPNSQSGPCSGINSKIHPNAMAETSEPPCRVANAVKSLETPACNKVVPNSKSSDVSLGSAVLNLDGPLTSGDEEPKNAVLSDGISQRKRRKRKKKRKKSTD